MKLRYDILGFWISVITLIITIVIFIYQQEILKKNEQILKRSYFNLQNLLS